MDFKKNVMNQIKDTGNGTFLIKKGFTYAITSIFVIAIGASWSFTWGVATERQQVVDTLNTHVTNGFVHNMEDDHIRKEDLKLYFEPMKIQLKNIEDDVKEIKNKNP